MRGVVFPDVEAALLVVLGDLGWTVTSTPPDLTDILTGRGAYSTARDVIRVQRVGGAPTPDRTTDEARVLVSCFAARDPARPRAAVNLSYQVEGLLTRFAGMVDIPAGLGGGRARVDRVDTVSGHVADPGWPDQQVQVVVSTYLARTRP